MTMRIVIENTDKSRKARVTPRYILPNGERTMQGASPSFEVAPESKGEFWIHSGQDCLIEEI